MASEDSRHGACFQSDLLEAPTDLCVESFLLIVRTGRIFTAHVVNLMMVCDMNEYRRIHGVSSK